MREKNLYTRDYYVLQRQFEENKFIDFLNSNSDITEFAQPFIIQIKNNLYNLVEKKEVDLKIDISNDIDNNFWKTVKGIEAIEKIDDSNIKNHLFSISINKTISRLFRKDGCNYEKYFVQNHIQSWLELLLAKSITSDERFSSFSTLKKVILQAEMLHYFYNYLAENIPTKWIEKDFQEWIVVDTENILSIIDPIYSYRDFFLHYKERISNLQSLSPYSSIKEAIEYSEYTKLSEEYSFKDNVLYSNDLSKWIKFWDNLKYPLLQDIPLNLKTPHEIIKILDTVLKYKKEFNSNISHLACILAINFFNTSYNATEMLSFYTNDDKVNSIHKYIYNKEIIEEGNKLAKNWEAERINLYDSFVKKLKKILPIEDIEEWVFSYNYRTTPQNVYSEWYNSEVYTLIESFSKIIENTSEIKNNFNLQKFNFYSSLIQKNKITIKPEIVLNELVNYINKENFYWDGTFAKPYWDTFKNIGFLLSIDEKSIDLSNNILDRVKVFYEGWNIKRTDYKLAVREVFIINGLLMFFEHAKAFKSKKQKKDYLLVLLNHIINQYRFSGFQRSNYLVAIQLINLIVNQLYKEKKYYFEKEIINNIDNIGDVLKIFSLDEYKLEEKSIKSFKKRIDRELLIYKKKIDQQNNRYELEFINSIVKKLE